ncbi:YihY/virulence factor BrkB family protein [Anaerovoracaceae bacterium 41-7]|uniref:YihY/virulence factor BrkB family protein n=1 Tax=Anaerotruncus colihominis TaxID=169435 RepID=A0A845QF56_9FIRM|nr:MULTISPECIES: YihY/virulence factor BrkB family protein [Clostridia]MCI9476892.1 YihY/virulence factor BrkB family protein [Emergencia sp.]MCI9640341.1 YihY/virulence factor BrkB family protein [Emergencia sp.]NBH60069.1 YihY/virulence factor BrkB family protein [Anaerotruncus colihominis]NCE99935.1 YihY/virulence factor BrkB family protein [Emergencia sp. 1XD21-10]NCF00723.1 YihY/virulence factor BrkB family protein [Anaerotruncus sp. 80]
MLKNRWIKMILLGIKQFSDPYYQGFAAQMSFYIMLSLVPTIIVLSQLLGILDISLDFLDEWIGEYVAPGMGDTLRGLLNYKPATTANIVLVIMALWASSRAQFSMMRITNYTYSDGRTTGSFWGERFRAVKTMALTVFTLAFVAIILVYGKLILQLFLGKLVEGTIIDTLWTWLRWPLAWVLYFLMVSYNYYVLPSEKLPFREILPGSILGAVGMLVVTIVYSYYADYTVNYDIIYGSLASMVALLFWFYFLSWVLCLGILFNKVWKDTKGGTAQ